jgi:hypothetical protein
MKTLERSLSVASVMRVCEVQLRPATADCTLRGSLPMHCVHQTAETFLLHGSTNVCLGSHVRATWQVFNCSPRQHRYSSDPQSQTRCSPISARLTRGLLALAAAPENATQCQGELLVFWARTSKGNYPIQWHVVYFDNQVSQAKPNLQNISRLVHYQHVAKLESKDGYSSEPTAVSHFPHFFKTLLTDMRTEEFGLYLACVEDKCTQA